MSSGAIIVAEGPDEQTYEFDLGEIYSLEARKEEIPAVTKMRAPELMRAMERGYSVSGQQLARAAALLSKLDMALDQRKAEVIIDIVPSMIKEKGASNNDATRSAIIELDSEYKRLRHKMIEVKALQELLKVKTRAFEMSFSAIKRVYDSTSNWAMDAGASANTRGGGLEAVSRTVDAVVGSVDMSLGFPIGKPRI